MIIALRPPTEAGTPRKRQPVDGARGAGLKDFHFHDLRHDGATRALNAGVTAPILMQLGGWKTEKMMRRYAAVTDASLRKAAEAVAGNETWQPRGNSAPIKTTG